MCPTLCDPMDCSPPGSSIHGILQARVLEPTPMVAIAFSRGSSRPRDRTPVSCIPGRCFNLWATPEVLHILEGNTGKAGIRETEEKRVKRWWIWVQGRRDEVPRGSSWVKGWGLGKHMWSQFSQESGRNSQLLQVESWDGRFWKKEEDWKNTWEECDGRSTQGEETVQELWRLSQGYMQNRRVYSSQSKRVCSSTAQNDLYRNRIIQKGHKDQCTEVHLGCRERRQVKLKLSEWARRVKSVNE